MTLQPYGSCDHEFMRFAGAFVKGNEVNIAVIERPPGGEGYGLAVTEAFSREAFPGDTSDPAKLLEYTHRIRQDLRDWGVRGVVLLETTRYSQWVYAQAQQRVLCIAALMFAAAEESIPYEVSKPSNAGAYLGSPKLEKVESSTFGLQAVPKYWTTGARDAYVAAAFAARDR